MAQSLEELKLEKEFKNLLDDLDIFHIKGNPRGLKGYPDKLIFLDKVYWVELKVGKEHGSYYKQKPMQKWWQEKIESAKGTYVLLVGRYAMQEFVHKLSLIKKEMAQ